MARGQGLAEQGQGRSLTPRAALVRTPRPRRALGAFLLLSLPLWSSAGGDVAPHIVFLVADDLGTELPSFCGGPLPTPSLDRLASKGTTFEAAYAAAPNCTPSRASILTGLYPFAHGAVGYGPLDAGVETLPSLLARAGYASYALGKLGVESTRPGALPAGVEGAPDEWPETAARVLAADHPVLLWIGLGEPHRPFPEPDLDPDFEPGPDPVAAQYLGDVPGYLFDTPETRAELAGYAAAIRRLDRRVGAILEAIDAAPRARPTLIVFVSDNGPAFPFGKATLYEAGIHVPLIVRWPDAVQRTRRSAALVSLVDLAPTLLAAAGVPVPPSSPKSPGFHGRSLAPLAAGDTQEERTAVLATIEEVYAGPPLPARSLRIGRWKYLRHYEEQRAYTTASTHTSTFRSWTAHFSDHPDLEARCRRFVGRQREQLYDLETDPFELHDLSADAAFRDDLAALRLRLDETLRALGDPRAAERSEADPDASTAR